METFLTPIAILGSTLLGFLFGYLWYSPILFSNTWLQVNKLTKETAPKRSTRYMTSITLYSFIAHTAVTTVLAVMFDIVQVTTLKMALSVGGLLALGFIVTTKYIDMLYTPEGNHYSRTQQIKFLLSAGYYLFSVLIISATLFFLTIK
jgi:hypothetical protein